MLALLTVLTALVCILLMGVVLIQNPKGGGLDSTFGGSKSANQMLGAAQTTDVIEKLTWGLAITLFVLCLLTSLVVGSGSGGDGQPASKTQESSLIISPEDAQQVEQAQTYYYKG